MTDVEKRLEKLEKEQIVFRKIAELQKEKTIELMEAIEEVSALKRRLKTIEYEMEKIEPNKVKEMMSVFKQTQKMVSVIIDRMNKMGV